MLLAALGSASASVVDDALHLDVSAAHLAFLESERDTLAGNALKAFGRKLRVVLKAGGAEEVDDSPPAKARPSRPAMEPANTKPASAAKGPNTAALRARAMADPVVERTLDLFGGTLLEVKPLDAAPDSSEDGAGE